MLFSIIDGSEKAFVTGFSYSVKSIPSGTENLGIRLAEGVEGTVRVLIGKEIVQHRFVPGYWMLEPSQSGYKIIDIADAELMVLIVSLSEIGSGSQHLHASATQHLYQWVLFKLAGESKDKILIEFLKYVRDWGTLGNGTAFSRGWLKFCCNLGWKIRNMLFLSFTLTTGGYAITGTVACSQ